MLTDPEVKRWASLMLTSALRGGTCKETICQQIVLLRTRHGTDALEEVLEAMLLEAGRIGTLHSDGTLYVQESINKPDRRPH